MSPKGGRRTPGSPEEWVEHAKSDLRMAQLAAKDKFVLPEQSCFHAQQAAEKAIKAALLLRGIGFPLTHDIEELLELAENGGIALPDVIKDASFLTPFAVETRYPGTWHEVTEEDLTAALKMAKTTLAWAEELIKKSRR